jgi:hypothetical protein
MRKTINSATVHSEPSAQQQWLDLEEVAKVEVTSQDSRFPLESALVPKKRRGWRAARRGKQIIRIVFDKPTGLRRIRLEFSEPEIERTHQFSLQWSAKPSGPFVEIVRQQWNFSPRGSTTEIEDYRVNLDGVSVLQLAIKLDLASENAYATLASWSVM